LLAKTLAELASVAGAAARRVGQERQWVPVPALGPPSPAETALGRDAPRDGTSTFLVASVEDAAGTAEHQADDWVRLLRDSAVREQIAAHGGIEMGIVGTPFAVAFPSARSAVLCAIGLQRILAGRAAERPAEPLPVRMGLHAGEATADAPGNPRRTRRLAARIASQAPGGRILVSAALKAPWGSDLAVAHAGTI